MNNIFKIIIFFLSITFLGSCTIRINGSKTTTISEQASTAKIEIVNITANNNTSSQTNVKDLGNINYGDESSNFVIEIMNTGTGKTNISSTEYFNLNDECEGTYLNPSELCKITVSFNAKPFETGEQTVDINLTAGNNEGNLDLSLKANRMGQPQLLFAERINNGAWNNRLTPFTDLGTITLNTSENNNIEYRITNNGESTAVFDLNTSVLNNGFSSTGSSTGTNCNSGENKLTSGESCYFVMQYSWTASSDETETIGITPDPGSYTEGSHSWSVRGYSNANANIIATVTDSVDPKNDRDLRNVQYGEATETVLIVFENTGEQNTGNVNINDISSNDYFDIQSNGCTNFILNANQANSCTVILIYNKDVFDTTAGQQVTITASDGVVSSAPVTITANRLSQARLSFDDRIFEEDLLYTERTTSPTSFTVNVDQGENKNIHLVIQNMGESNATFNLNITEGNFTIDHNGCTTETLEGNGGADTCMIELNYAYESSGAETTATIQITETGSTENSHTWIITGHSYTQYTISATVSGMVSDNITLQNNGGNDLTFNTSGEHFFTGTYREGYLYNVSISSMALGHTCYISGENGTLSDNVTVNLECYNGTIEALYPANGANWNDYVKNDAGNGVEVFNATDLACQGNTEPGAKGYYACIHGGEYRKVNLYGRTSCSNITAGDNLDVFDWTCIEGTNPETDPAYVSSYKIKENKQLSDLINTAELPFVWNNNFVTVSENATPVVITESSNNWWSNTISELSPATGGTNESITINGGETNTIYVITSDINNDIEIESDKIGLLVLPDITITGVDMHTIDGRLHSYLWIEGGNINANNNQSGIYTLDTHFSVIKNTSIRNAANFGIDLADGSTRNKIENVKIQESGLGIYASTNSSYNIIKDVRSNGNISFQENNNTAFNINVSSSNTGTISLTGMNHKAVKIIGANNNLGLSSSGSRSSFVANVSTLNNAGDGIANPEGTYNVSYNNILSSNNLNGMYILNTTDSNYHQTFNNMVFANDMNGIIIQGSSENYFTGTLKIGAQVFNCNFAGSINNNTGIQDYNADNCSSEPANILQGLSDANIILNGVEGGIVNSSNAFIGKVTSDDMLNPVDTNGTALFTSLENTSNWTLLENNFRTWGIENIIAFPDPALWGPCSSGTCRIYDWSLQNSNTVFLNINASIPNGDDYLIHLWDASDQNDCENNIGGTWGDGTTAPYVCSLPGRYTQESCGLCTDDQYTTQSTCETALGAGAWTSGDWDTTPKCYSVYLKNAYEQPDDLTGDDDYICESGEICIFSPNAGAYQGHGNLIPAGFFIDGEITGVTLLEYENNGY